MKVLIVCSGNSGRIAPFILEQGESLTKIGVEIAYFTIEGRGLSGYLRNRKRLLRKIASFSPQLIHAHYGLSGLLANLQRRIPVVTTYHGSDINNPKVLLFSRLSMLLSVHNIFVSEKSREKSGQTKKQSVIPCGVDLNVFKPMDKEQARKASGLDIHKKLILFAGAFDNLVKNAALAKEALKWFPEVELIELKGYSREQVALLMNAADVALMTSFTEGSPQFIKEAMACNCPVVSVEVGDVKEIIADVQGCYLCTYDSNDLADRLQQVFSSGTRIQGRELLIKNGFDINNVAEKIIRIYNSIL